MPESDLELIINAARDAGEIALGYFKQSIKIWEKDDGAGPVTDADLAVNAHLTMRLRSAQPDYGWLSEETEDNQERLATKRQFVIDPIDGTRSFIDGSRDWAVAIAVVEDGRPIAAVVYLPARDSLYSAILGGGAKLNGDAMKVGTDKDLADATILTSRPNLRPEFWKDGKRPYFDVAFRSSLAYRVCLAASGRFDAMLTLRPTWEWDIAAGALIAAEAGGIALDKTGAPLRFNNPEPKTNGALIGAPKVTQAVLSAML